MTGCRALFDSPIYTESQDDVETDESKYDGSVLPLCQHITCWIHDSADSPLLTWSDVRNKFNIKASAMEAVKLHLKTYHHVESTTDDGVIAFTHTYLDRTNALTFIMSVGITPAMIATFTPEWVVRWAQAYAFGLHWHHPVVSRNRPRLLKAYKAYREYWIRLICVEHNILAAKFNPFGSSLMKNYGVMTHIPCDHPAMVSIATELRFYQMLATIQEQAGAVLWRSDYETAYFLSLIHI